MITCKFENGDEANLRHVVMDSIAIKGSQILLCLRGSKIVGAGKYCLPGGFLNQGETTKEGILRELEEETGYSGKIVKLLEIVDGKRKGETRQNVSFVYLINVGEKIGEPDNETKKVAWFPLDKLPAEEQFAFDHFETIKNYIKGTI